MSRIGDLASGLYKGEISFDFVGTTPPVVHRFCGSARPLTQRTVRELVDVRG